ncbi:TetR/AcrR family transcriptional regulator [Bosea caraganae]|uniref:TetR/AcrR family transcriptional regulator n=1 Tax=Bosea caraganae TaxID=2763117 RepID=A0A370LB73_9HYPH|nr:TetR/AcrR family transcriptional regulator [Bosea caraganae]RDJ27053.1 TetR/AcrR family transcriptional regulator [Bosea caraganae]RDJ29070.1 TetR/AcrR family transcriptional regulator [Bosea caraganae]
MARPLSEAKRDAILASAIKLVAAQGTGAPTSGIARDAGLAEGTLFTYFASKDELLNQLYLELKADLGAAILKAYPAEGSARDRFEHVWNGFVDWGFDHPASRKAIRQLAVSDRITEASRRQGSAAFGEISAMLEQSRSEGVLKDHPLSFIGAVLEALTDATLELVAREPAKRAHYKKAGFDVLWHGIAN